MPKKPATATKAPISVNVWVSERASGVAVMV